MVKKKQFLKKKERQLCFVSLEIVSKNIKINLKNKFFIRVKPVKVFLNGRLIFVSYYGQIILEKIAFVSKHS